METPSQVSDSSLERVIKSVPLVGALTMAAIGCSEPPARTAEGFNSRPTSSTIQPCPTDCRRFDFRPVRRDVVASKVDDGECNIMENRVDFTPDEKEMKLVLECIDGTRFVVIQTCGSAWQVDSQKHPYCDGTEQREYYQVLQRR